MEQTKRDAIDNAWDHYIGARQEFVGTAGMANRAGTVLFTLSIALSPTECEIRSSAGDKPAVRVPRKKARAAFSEEISSGEAWARKVKGMKLGLDEVVAIHVQLPDGSLVA